MGIIPRTASSTVLMGKLHLLCDDGTRSGSLDPSLMDAESMADDVRGEHAQGRQNDDVRRVLESHLRLSPRNGHFLGFAVVPDKAHDLHEEPDDSAVIMIIC